MTMMIAPLLLSAVTAVSALTDTVTVADAALMSSLSAGVDTVDNFVVAGGERRLAATFVQTIRPEGAGYLIVQENRSGSGSLLTLDSIVVTAGTLATVSHADVTPNGRRHVAFSGGRMIGFAVDTLGNETPVDESVPADFFDYSIMALVADHLPLAAGYEATLATYDVTRGAVYVPVRVVGEEEVTLGDRIFAAWRMEMAVGERVVTRWVDRTSRRELRWSVDLDGRAMNGESRPGGGSSGDSRR